MQHCRTYNSCRAAELLNSIPEDAAGAQGDATAPQVPVISTQNLDPTEAQLEAAELNKYLLAKTLFDCREFDRCAAVFLPNSLLSGIVSSQAEDALSQKRGQSSAAGKDERAEKMKHLPRLSQRSLFLALYAKFMSGEKRKDEDAEMVMGPHDQGTAKNAELRVISAYLSQWFAQNAMDESEHGGSQGWLEYL
jgi:anaphase-promoting complex subunit 8